MIEVRIDVNGIELVMYLYTKLGVWLEDQMYAYFKDFEGGKKER